MQNVRKFFTDKDDHIVLWQKPNLFLVGWLVLLILAKLLPTGGWQSWAGHVSTGSLLIWAVLEIGWGATYFRRLLGLVVLGLMIASRL